MTRHSIKLLCSYLLNYMLLYFNFFKVDCYIDLQLLIFILYYKVTYIPIQAVFLCRIIVAPIFIKQ